MIITSITPERGCRGWLVTLRGSGWSPDDVSVRFLGAEAELIHCDATSLAVVAPNIDSFPYPCEVAVLSNGNMATTTFTYIYAEVGSEPPVNPVHTAITAAWNAMFQPGPANLPATLVADNPIVAIADIGGLIATQQQCDSCWDPQDPYMNAVGNATVDLDSMWLQGLSTLASGGDPAFTATGDGVSFPVTLGQLGIGGAWTVTQQCASFGNDSTMSQTGGLSATIAAATYWLDAAIAVDPTTQLPQVNISAMVGAVPPEVQFAFSYDQGLPKWLLYLTGEWITEQQLGDVVGRAFTTAFAEGILPQISYLINVEVAALTQGSRS